MKKTKYMITGFAIFAATLMLMTASLTGIQAAENTGQTATQTKESTSVGYCLALLASYRAINKALEDPSWTDEEIEILEYARDAILDEAENAGCLWVSFSLENGVQSSPIQMNTNSISPINGVATGPVQASSSSQSTCQLCATR